MVLFCLGDIARCLETKVRQQQRLSDGRLAVCGNDRHDEGDAPGTDTRRAGGPGREEMSGQRITRKSAEWISGSGVAEQNIKRLTPQSSVVSQALQGLS